MSDTSSTWGPTTLRTHYCGSLRREHVGTEVVLAGWVQRQRDMGNLVFVDLRDREGTVQVVFPPDKPDLQSEAKKLRMEYVAGVRGVVRARGEKSVNPQMETGEVEVEATGLRVFNPSRVPPFLVTDPVQATEELRLKHRPLDLRRPSMQGNIRLRHEAALRVRNYLGGRGFLEIETPFLTKSTPEGARDFLVPSRFYKGRFYALPQSPQLFKQALMIAGFDRYFQVVRCFRDEAVRADRQLEFTQIDIEMSFVEREDVLGLVEGMVADLFEIIGAGVRPPFPRLSYPECLERFGTDKPDLRITFEIRDLSGPGAETGSEVIRKALAAGGALKALLLPGAGGLSRSRLDKLDQQAKGLGLPGLIWMKKAEGGGFKSSLKMSEADGRLLWERLGAGEADLALLAAGPREVVLRGLGEIRRDALPLPAGAEKSYHFLWVTDFPMFEWSEEEGRPVAMHHPFTSPRDEDLERLETEPLSVRAKAYDLVLNGHEIGGGSIRIHDAGLQKRIFQALGLTEAETEEKFGFFLETLPYGTPPHGGIAFGFDRIVMILAGETSIREVIAFPKTTSGLDLFSGSPSPVAPRQLDELGLKIEE
jgi:aspartyl-tRNA synthetase